MEEMYATSENIPTEQSTGISNQNDTNNNLIFCLRNRMTNDLPIFKI